jgi:hemolysin activation/secretion protein
MGYVSKNSFLRVIYIAVGVASVFSGAANAALTDLPDSIKSLSERVSIDVTSFVIRGENPISDEASYQVVNKYLGPSRSIEDIELAAEELETRLHSEGKSFYRVSFPPQELSDGSIELLVKRYKIGKINVTGNQHYSTRNITASLPQLRAGNSPSTQSMARSLTVANQNPGKRTRLTLASGERDDEIDATLSVVDQNPVVASVWLNNTGTSASGDLRVGANLSHRNLFGRDHVAGVTFISSPENFSEVQQYSANYRIPIYKLGGKFDFFAVKSEVDTGVVAEVFDVAGRGEVFGAAYTQILAKRGEFRHQLSLQFTDKLFDNDIRFQGVQIVGDVRSRPIALAYQGSWQNGKGFEVGGGITATQNLNGGSENNQISYQGSRIGARQDWTKFDIAMNAQYTNGRWLYLASLNFSNTNDRLITGEQFAIGGTSSIRGFEERELRGDRGARLNFQAWAPAIRERLRPIAFIDLGRVKNNSPIAGEFGSESVSSIGLMLNWNPTNHITTSASYGYVIDGVDFGIENQSTSTRDGSGKAHFNLSYRF